MWTHMRKLSVTNAPLSHWCTPLVALIVTRGSSTLRLRLVPCDVAIIAIAKMARQCVDIWLRAPVLVETRCRETSNQIRQSVITRRSRSRGKWACIQSAPACRAPRTWVTSRLRWLSGIRIVEWPTWALACRVARPTACVSSMSSASCTRAASRRSIGNLMASPTGSP